MSVAAPRLINQVKGVLLEEAVLLLLESSGYRIAKAISSDPTLSMCAAGLRVHGRGGEHQIDAIADYVISQPFTYPQRLLVEAKCYAVQDVDLAIVRNALGVFRDVAEYWSSPPGTAVDGRRRYHYQYAVFATTDFTMPAQRFAYAHDINLLPLRRSAFLAPVVKAIENAARSIARPISSRDLRLSDVRVAMRTQLRSSAEIQQPVLLRSLAAVTQACRVVREAYLAMAGGVFPLFLVPVKDLDVRELRAGHTVHLSLDRDSEWLIRDSVTGRALFSLDIPAELLGMYARSGALSRRASGLSDDDAISELQFIAVRGGLPHLVSMRLDGAWVERVQVDASRPQ